MATNLETETKPFGAKPVRPSLKIIRLHIRNLKSITALDLPADGLGWSGPMPDMLMIGGINGSGKTTLLDLIESALSVFDAYGLDDEDELEYYGGLDSFPPAKTAGVEILIDFRIDFDRWVNETIRFVVGAQGFIEKHATDNTFGFVISEVDDKLESKPIMLDGEAVNRLHQVVHHRLFVKNNILMPSVVYIPSERRDLVMIEEQYKMPGRIFDPEKFVLKWTSPREWKESLEARMYALRWEDLNDKEEGRPEGAVRFASYAKVFDRFFEGRKRLKWHRGELVVETKSGDIHNLAGLSSGERQVILFMGELLQRWSPGSLILIDEPELHLHEIYQSTLWSTLEEWQAEKGGQVIVATQSDNLFRTTDPGIKVLLGRGRQR